MSRRSVRLVDALVACPACGSRAVAGILARSEGEDASACLVHCAGCDLWRGVMVRHWEAWSIERRLRRRVRRELRRPGPEILLDTPEGRWRDGGRGGRAAH